MRLGSVPSIFQDVLVYYKDLYGLLENISTKQHCKNGVKTFLHPKSKGNLLFYCYVVFAKSCCGDFQLFSTFFASKYALQSGNLANANDACS